MKSRSATLDRQARRTFEAQVMEMASELTLLDKQRPRGRRRGPDRNGGLQQWCWPSLSFSQNRSSQPLPGVERRIAERP
jgi:hypothetical protein